MVTTAINRRADARDAKQRHQWEMEDREAKAAQVKADLEAAKSVVRSQTEAIRTDLAANTEITRQASAKADAAFEAANHVNEKIASLAGGRQSDSPNP